MSKLLSSIASVILLFSCVTMVSAQLRPIVSDLHRELVTLSIDRGSSALSEPDSTYGSALSHLWNLCKKKNRMDNYQVVASISNPALREEAAENKLRSLAKKKATLRTTLAILGYGLAAAFFLVPSEKTVAKPIEICVRDPWTYREYCHEDVTVTSEKDYSGSVILAIGAALGATITLAMVSKEEKAYRSYLKEKTSNRKIGLLLRPIDGGSWIFAVRFTTYIGL